VAGRDEIIAFCDELLEAGGFEDYGPNGLQVPGSPEVGRVATGVTANLEFLKRAVEAKAQLAIAHHGLFFGDSGGGLSEQLARRLRTALCAGLSVAGYHLPLDAHPEVGNNALLCRALGFEPGDPFGEVKGRRIGLVAGCPGRPTAGELRERITGLLGREPLLIEGGPERIGRIGVVTGAGASVLDEAAALGLDAFLTGEPAEHALGDAREAGLHFYAAGHYATETFGVRKLGELVAERFGVEHEFIDVPNPI
jgi:dinuclear metal center YbgI/SA1388 family protein